MKQRQGSGTDIRCAGKGDFQTFKPTIIASSVLLAVIAMGGCGKPTNITSLKGDNTSPSVLALIPKQSQTVPVSQTMAADFSEPLNLNTVSTGSFFLMSGDVLHDPSTAHIPIPGTVSYAEDSTLFSGIPETTPYVALYIPNGNLAPNKTYSLLTTKAITDVAGNRLDQLTPVIFTTEAKPTTDTTPPTVSDTLPANGAKDISINRSIVVTFSEPVQFVDETSFTIYDDSNNQVTGTVNVSGNSATFKPDSSLGYSTTYTATITTDVADTAVIPNHLVQDYMWSFTTAAADTGGGTTTPVDTTPPSVSSVTPRDNAIDIVGNTAISASFDEAIDPTTVNTSTFMLESIDANTGNVLSTVTGTVAYNGTTATFKPGAVLAADTKYRATLTTGITDLAGNAMTADYMWSFTTAAPVAGAPTPTPPQDTTPPTVTAVTPINGATDVSTNSAISVDFSEGLDPATINTASFLLTGGSNGTVAGTVSYNGTSATFTPLNPPLENSTTYTAILTSSITDLAGNNLVSNYAWSFTTAAPATPVDTTPPEVLAGSQVPVDLASNVAINSAISVSFTEALNPNTVNTSTFTLKDSIGNSVAGSVHYTGTTATFTPLQSLSNSMTYTASLSSSITDLAGNALVVPANWSFTTAAPAAPIDNTPPTIKNGSYVPSVNATNVPITTSISAQFSEALDPSTITSASVTLRVGGATGYLVAGSVQYSSTNNAITFVPSTSLAYSSTYAVTISSAVTDLAGNAFAGTTWSFQTAAAPAAPNNGMGGGQQGGGQQGGGGGM